MNQSNNLISNLAYPFVRSSFSFLSKILTKVSIQRDHQVLEESCIVVANHISVFDPLYLSSVHPNQISFLCSDDFYNNPFSRWLFRSLKTIPVRRPFAERSFFKLAKEMIEEGYDLGIFLEGGTNFKHREDRSVCIDANKVRNGAVYLARKLGLKILPVAICGTYDLYKYRNIRPDVIINYGAPVDPASLGRHLKPASMQLANIIKNLYSDIQGDIDSTSNNVVAGVSQPLSHGPQH